MKDLKIYYERNSMFPGHDGVFCKTNPDITFVDKNVAFLSYTMLKMNGSDTFYDEFCVKSIDGGKTFLEPRLMRSFKKKTPTGRETYFKKSTFYHKKQGKFICFLMKALYDENDVILRNNTPPNPSVHLGYPFYVFRDNETGDYVGEPIELKLPFKADCFSPFGQPIEFDNGDVLMNFYGAKKGEGKYYAWSMILSFDGKTFTVKDYGERLTCKKGIGFSEASIATLNDKYYITLRGEEEGYLAVSKDGLNYDEPIVWKWDDGTILENYMTQQRWLRFKDGLYLAYTRKGANNDHVFRHRAPMFMARFDEDNLCLIKSTEVILVPELGARLGNFNITDVSDTESWLVTAEWMQTWPPEWYNYKICERYGSNNSIWVAKVKVIED